MIHKEAGCKGATVRDLAGSVYGEVAECQATWRLSELLSFEVGAQDFGSQDNALPSKCSALAYYNRFCWS